MASSLINTINSHSDNSIIMTEKQFSSTISIEKLREVRKKCARLPKHNVHFMNALTKAGLLYNCQNDTAYCDSCGLEISNWEANTNLLAIHTEHSPTCRSVCLRQKRQNTTDESTNQHQKPTCVRPKLIIEDKTAKEARARTFSNWPHEISPSRTQMIEAGFHRCNVLDRVICLHCNLICQGWKPFVDDPIDVHRKLSPECPFVKTMLPQPEQLSNASISIVNLQSTNRTNESVATLNSLESLHYGSIASASPHNSTYSELTKREASFTNWPSEGLPTVEDLIRAGFFYSGVRTTVTCFYCNGSLHEWSPEDQPIVKHVLSFPQCTYIKQVCGEEKYHKIQEENKIAKG